MEHDIKHHISEVLKLPVVGNLLVKFRQSQEGFLEGGEWLRIVIWPYIS